MGQARVGAVRSAVVVLVQVRSRARCLVEQFQEGIEGIGGCVDLDPLAGPSGEAPGIGAQAFGIDAVVSREGLRQTVTDGDGLGRRGVGRASQRQGIVAASLRLDGRGANDVVAGLRRGEDERAVQAPAGAVVVAGQFGPGPVPAQPSDADHRIEGLGRKADGEAVSGAGAEAVVVEAGAVVGLGVAVRERAVDRAVQADTPGARDRARAGALGQGQDIVAALQPGEGARAQHVATGGGGGEGQAGIGAVAARAVVVEGDRLAIGRALGEDLQIGVEGAAKRGQQPLSLRGGEDVVVVQISILGLARTRVRVGQLAPDFGTDGDRRLLGQDWRGGEHGQGADQRRQADVTHEGSPNVRRS